MNVWAWILLALMVFELIVHPYNVGKPRNAKTPGEAVAGVANWAVYIGLLLLAVLA